jgi:hypothetical protein
MIDKLSNENENCFAIEFAKSLFLLECIVSKQHFFCAEEEFIAAIVSCWDLVQEYCIASVDILSVPIISVLHKTLATKIGAPDPGKFIDEGGIEGSWSSFTEELDVKETIKEFGACENCYIIAKLFWGGHLPNLQLSVGWLCINALGLKYGYSLPSYPPKHIHEELLKCLKYAGPDCWDAESLRALIG